jgi:hypothetical protein
MTKIAKQGEVPQPDLTKIREGVKAFLSSLNVWDFVDPHKPWVMVPNGSFSGFFDWVPPVFREGPWAILPTIYITAAICMVLFSTVHHCAKYGVDNLPSSYYDAFTAPWYLNLAGFAWTSYVFRDIFVSGLGIAAMTTFTVQSYSLIFLRFGLSTLVPFFPKQLAAINELLRYPALSQATITFVVWNAILAPVIFACIKDNERRKGFIKYFTSFRLTQLHVFNMCLAVITGLYGTPQRALQWTDLHAAILSGLQYSLFYIFILDRLGIHFYLIFSPRTNIALVSWSLVIATTLGLHSFWSRMIESHGGYWAHGLPPPGSAE